MKKTKAKETKDQFKQLTSQPKQDKNDPEFRRTTRPPLTKEGKASMVVMLKGEFLFLKACDRAPETTVTTFQYYEDKASAKYILNVIPGYELYGEERKGRRRAVVFFDDFDELMKIAKPHLVPMKEEKFNCRKQITEDIRNVEGDEFNGEVIWKNPGIRTTAMPKVLTPSGLLPINEASESAAVDVLRYGSRRVAKNCRGSLGVIRTIIKNDLERLRKKLVKLESAKEPKPIEIKNCIYDIEEYSSLLQKLTEIGKKYDPRHIRFERITSSGFYLRSRIRRSEQQLTMSNILCIQTAPDFELKAVKPREKSDLVELGVFAGFVVYLKII